MHPSSGNSPSRNGADQQGPLGLHQATTAEPPYNSLMKIANCNVRAFYHAGQLENLKQEMRVLEIDIE